MAGSNDNPYVFNHGMYATFDYEDVKETYAQYRDGLEQMALARYFDSETEEFCEEGPRVDRRLQTKEIPLYGILQASVELDEEVALTWSRTGFDLADSLHAMSGPFIEVAGPTSQKYHILGDLILPKTVHVFNKYNESIEDYSHCSDEETRVYYERFASKGLDVMADARELPLRGASVGAVFVSCLPAKDEQGDLRLAAMDEATRVLQPSGLLVWKGAFYHDLVRADRAGLELAAVQIHDNELEEIIFRKPGLN